MAHVLKRIVKHVNTINRISEEDACWREYDQYVKRGGSRSRRHRSSSSSDSDVRRRHRSRSRQRRSPVSRDVDEDEEERRFNRELKRFSERSRACDRWGHGGFHEQWGSKKLEVSDEEVEWKECKSSESSGEEKKNSSKGSKKRKKEKKHKKKKKKRHKSR